MSVLDVLAVTDAGSDISSGEAAAAAGGVGMILIVGLVFYLIAGFLLYKVFEKAGRPGWAGFVPIYNMWVLFEISGKPGWWALLILPSAIPLIGLLFSLAFAVLSLLAMLELAKRFGKGPVFGVLALWMFSIIGYAILAFDSSKYQAVGVSSSAPNSPGATTPSQTPQNPTQ